MSILRQLFGESRAVSFQDVWGRGLDFNGSSVTGTPVNERKALQLTAVWACVRLIAETCASLPTDAFVRNGSQRESFRPRPAWMSQPNPEQTPITFWEQYFTSLLLYGNAYLYVVRNQIGDVLELWPLHPDDVTPKRDGRLRYEARDSEGRPFTLFPGESIVHVPAFCLPGALTGMNPVSYAKQAIGLGLATEEFGARWFSQGSTPSVALEVQKSLSDESAKRMALSWKAAHTGLRNSHMPAVLEGGTTVKPLTIPNDQAQFLETRRFQVSEIARMFRVPPHMIADVEKSTSWGSGIEEQGIGFVTYTLRPWLERTEQAATALFPPATGAFMKFNVEGLLRGNTKARYDAYAVALNNGFNNIDEIRSLEDEPPLPDGKGQEFLRPLNMGPVGTPTPNTKESDDE